MKKENPYLPGVWFTGVTAIYQCMVFIYAHYYLSSPAHAAWQQYYPGISLLNIGWPVLFLIESIIYWMLRYRVYRKSWVQLHAISQFIIFVAIPFLLFAAAPLMARSVSTDDLLTLHKNKFYFSWTVFIVGHIFFIATIAAAITHKKQPEPDEPSPGILDEFID